MMAIFLCAMLACQRPPELPVRVVTVYHAVPEQTDATPTATADGSRLTPAIIHNRRYCAVSQDLLWFRGGPLHYGDSVLVDIDSELAGLWIVHDTMHENVTGYVDLLVPQDVTVCWVAEGVKVRHPGRCRQGVKVYAPGAVP